MPELPEVQTVVTTLQPLVGRRLGLARVHRLDVLHGEPLDLNRFAKGRTIDQVRRRAKRIIFEIGNGRQIQFHLGMSGQLTVKPCRQELLPHTHLQIRIAGSADELRFRDVRRFGGVWLLDATSQLGGRGLGRLGPDALEITLPEFRRLLDRPRRIKAALLDQKLLAGLGNIYVDESLFQARVHPLTRAADLDDAQVRRLHRAIRGTLQAAIQAGGSTIRDYYAANGEQGWFQLRHRVYGRAGQPCRRCRTPLVKLRAAGRGTHICPQCQSEPRP